MNAPAKKAEHANACSALLLLKLAANSRRFIIILQNRNNSVIILYGGFCASLNYRHHRVVKAVFVAQNYAAF